MDRFRDLLLDLGTVRPGDIVLFRGDVLDGEAQEILRDQIVDVVGHSDFLLVLLGRDQGMDILDAKAMAQHGWVRADGLQSSGLGADPKGDDGGG